MDLEENLITVRLLISILLLNAVSAYPSSLADISTLLNENRLDEGKEVCLSRISGKFLDKKQAFACVWIFLRSDDIGNADRILEQLKTHSTSDEYKLAIAYKYAVRKNFDEAERLLREIRAEKKGTPVANRAELLRAEVMEKKGGIETAAFIYKQLVNEIPNDPRLNWALGRWHLSRGETERAMEYMEKVAAHWPTHVASRFNLALILLAKGKEGAKSAGKYLSECYRLNKKDPEVLEQLGNVFELSDKPQEAIKYWQLALELNPKSATLRKKMDENYGAVIDRLIDQKKFREAQMKLEANPGGILSQSVYQLKYAIVLRNMGSFSRAVQKFEEVIKQNPDEVVAYRELGICYLNQQKWDVAKLNFAKAISLEPGNGMNYAWLAFVLEGKREWDGALEMWEKSLTLLKDPKEMERAEAKVKSLKRKLRKPKNAPKSEESED